MTNPSQQDPMGAGESGFKTDSKGKRVKATSQSERERKAAAAREALELDAKLLGNRPILPKTLTIGKGDHPCELPAGFYVMFGGTGSGKTISAVALVAQQIAEGGNGYHMYCFEARGPNTVKPSEFVDALETVMTGSTYDYAKTLFETIGQATSKAAQSKAEKKTKAQQADKATMSGQFDAEETFRRYYSGMGQLGASAGSPGADAAKLFLGNVHSQLNSDPSLLVIDSLSIPMRQYGSTIETIIKGEAGDKSGEGRYVEVRTRRGEATMTGGFQPSDIQFCVEMERIALNTNTVILGIVNFDLVPFTDKLEGVTEGFVSIERPGLITYRQRKSRRPSRYVIPKKYIDIAAVYLNYDDPKNFNASSWTGFEFN